ncbi:MAG: dioxygenase, partial [Alphaproteobacteria bacterium]|nr:dioxygenase [Alphaproteobacteria bacterium]
LDHGAWVPLTLIYPQADIPVAQVSVQPARDAAWHRSLGRALAPLRDEGVLILASGGITHSLRDWTRFHRQPAAPAQPFAADFATWIGQRLEAGDDAGLDAWRDAPEAARNHPTPEHLLPLFVAQGAGGRARRLHSSSTYGVLMMDVWAFE